MSTGLNCDFVEIKSGEWYLVLEHDNAPKMTWDWHEYATAYGPFKSEAGTNEFLSTYFANPGGCTIYRHDSEDLPVLEKEGKRTVLGRLIDEAPENKRDLERSFFGGGWRP